MPTNIAAQLKYIGWSVHARRNGYVALVHKSAPGLYLYLGSNGNISYGRSYGQSVNLQAFNGNAPCISQYVKENAQHAK